MAKYFESHAHYDDESFDCDRNDVLNSLTDNGIGIVINSGASVHSSEKAAELAKKYSFIYSAAGVHPHDAGNMQNSDINILSELCGYEKTVAVGEIGLDYYRDLSPRDTQKHWFNEQISLAVDVGLPVIIHSRDAEADTLKIVAQSDARKVGGVIHCFSGSKETAREYVKLGFYIGVGGVLTYQNARKLVEVVEAIPLTSILIETDCPYLSPSPLRGRRNDSRNLKYIVSKIAEIKNVTEEKVMDVTFENGLTLFNIKV